MKIIFLFATTIVLAVASGLSYNQASRIPSVISFEKDTGLSKEIHLLKALNNIHWQNANKYFYGKTIKTLIGKKILKTLPYHRVIDELKMASSDGVVLAMYQGFNFSSIATGKQGKYAIRDTSYFAKKLMVKNICMGYIETAHGYSRGWYRNRNADWESAYKVIVAGEKVCNKKLNPFLKHQYNRNLAQYSAMKDYSK